MHSDCLDTLALHMCKKSFDHVGWQKEEIKCKAERHSAIAKRPVIGELVEGLHHPVLERIGAEREGVELLRKH
jgi:hypothetical protein